MDKKKTTITVFLLFSLALIGLFIYLAKKSPSTNPNNVKGQFTKQLSGPWEYVGLTKEANIQASLGNQNKAINVEIASEKYKIGFNQKDEETTLEKQTDNSVIYKTPDSEIKYTLDPNGLKEEITLNSSQAIKNSYLFEINLQNLDLKKDESSGLWFFEKKDGQEPNKKVFYIPQPFMTDANNVKSEKVEIKSVQKEGKNYLEIVPDRSWLNDPSRKFPIIIDPTVTTSETSYATSYSFQRKTWYDGTRYWFGTQSGSSIKFYYSTDGSSWTENTSAAISVSSPDFSIQADSSYAFIVYNGSGIGTAVSKATSYPGAGFGWETATAAFPEGGSYFNGKVAISLDTNGKIWATTAKVTSGGFADPSFLAGTKITMTNGSYKNIEEVKAGDLVTGFDPDTLSLLSNTVTGTSIHEVNSYVLLETASSKVITTENHYFYTGKNEYKPVAELNAGDAVYIYDNNQIKQENIFSKQQVSEAITVYDFSTDNNHNFIADNFLVHNTTYNTYFSAVRSVNAYDISSWESITTLYSLIDSATAVYSFGTIVPLTSGSMYTIWATGGAGGTTIYGKKYNGSAWDVSATTIATGPAYDFTKNISAVSDSSGNIHLTYIDSSGYVKYQKYTTSWQTAVTLDSNAGNSSPSVSIDVTHKNTLYVSWIRSNTIYYKKGVSPYVLANWETDPATLYNTGTNTYLSSGYRDGNYKIPLLWTNGAGSPYNIMWNYIQLPVPSVEMQGVNVQGANFNVPAPWHQGPFSPGTMADDASVGTVSWTDTDNAKTSNDAYATSISGGGYSHYLKATNFGFSIPVGATINGIFMEIERMGAGPTYDLHDHAVKVVKSDGTIGTTNKASGTPWVSLSNIYYSYGSSSDLWGEVWSSSDINDVDFGVVLETHMDPGNPKVDHVRITVYYTN